jgi:membrane-associated protease RseP (regulator of RpoE activity)
MGLLGWVIFLLILCFSITLHEAGHFLTAKKFGMKVTRFFVGFGPTLWSVHRGETEYGVKALLIGGFCKIVGMHSLDDVDDPADEPRSFRSKPAWQRLVVLYAGIAMNVILGFVLIIGIALAIGIPNDNTTQLGTVTSCVAANVTALDNGACGGSKTPSPAAAAGLRVGDTVVAFNGKPVSNWTDLGNLIKATAPGSEISITVRRDGQLLTRHTKLAHVPGRGGGYMGIAPTTAFQIASPLGAVKYAGSFTSEIFTGMGHAIANLPSSTGNLFNTKQRSSESGGQVASVVTFGQQTSQAVSAAVGWRSKAEVVVALAAELNFILGLGNILPLMPLDGGLASVVAWESIRSRYARLRGRPDPGPVDIRKVVPVMVGLFAILAVFSVVVLLADIVNPLSLGQ